MTYLTQAFLVPVEHLLSCFRAHNPVDWGEERPLPQRRVWSEDAHSLSPLLASQVGHWTHAKLWTHSWF